MLNFKDNKKIMTYVGKYSHTNNTTFFLLLMHLLRSLTFITELIGIDCYLPIDAIFPNV